MNLTAVFSNPVLIASLTSWGLAQIVKLPIDYLRYRKWNWAMLLSTGGMPSSHSALVSAVSFSLGLFTGFDSPLFALSAVLAMVVVYDATGIRRQAGKHAELINAIVNDLTTGHPIKEQHQKQLKEILGHTWLEAIWGIVWGLLISTLVWLLWR